MHGIHVMSWGLLRMLLGKQLGRSSFAYTLPEHPDSHYLGNRSGIVPGRQKYYGTSESNVFSSLEAPGWDGCEAARPRPCHPFILLASGRSRGPKCV